MNPLVVLVLLALVVGLLFVAFMDHITDHDDWSDDEPGAYRASPWRSDR